MDVTDRYALALGGLVALTVVAKFTLCIPKLKWVGYRQFHHVVTCTSTQTRSFLFFSSFLIGNILALSLYINKADTLMKRSGLLCLINLVLLMLGGRMNLMVDHCGISLATLAAAHRWLGWLCTIEGIIHVTAAFLSNQAGLRSVRGIAGLVGSAVLLAMLLSSVLRRHLHEVFLWVHYLFAILVIISIYLHLPGRELLQIPGVYVLAASSLLVLMSAAQLLHLLFRNIRRGQPLNEASVRQIHFKRPQNKDITVMDAVEIHVRLSAPWMLRPGQYVYLCVPGASVTSFAQMHPFYVAWGYRGETGEQYAVFVVQKKKGFTENIASHASGTSDECSTMKTVVSGPFGKGMDLGLFGTVLLFATGIGIAAQLPYVSQLLAGYQDNETRRIVLFWQVDSEVQTAWVADQMQELLKRDVNMVLDIRLFVAGDFLSETTRRGDHIKLGTRIDLTYDGMNAEDLVGAEMNGRKGRVVISLCVDRKTNRKIREVVRRSSRIHLEELPFNPGEETGIKDIVKAVAEVGRVVLDQVRTH